MSQTLDLWLNTGKDALKTILSPLEGISAIFSNMFLGLGMVGGIFVLLLVYCIIRYGKTTKRYLEKSKTLVIAALMIALNLALRYFEPELTPTMRIGFGFITQPMVATMFGPLVACMTGMIQDVLGCILKPTGGLLPAYTLCVGIAGMLYGMVLYGKPTTFWRVLWVEFLVIFLVNITLNSIALAPLAGSGFVGILPGRIIKNLLVLPIQCVITYWVLRVLRRIRR